MAEKWIASPAFPSPAACCTGYAIFIGDRCTVPVDVELRYDKQLLFFFFVNGTRSNAIEHLWFMQLFVLLICSSWKHGQQPFLWLSVSVPAVHVTDQNMVRSDFDRAGRQAASLFQACFLMMQLSNFIIPGGWRGRPPACAPLFLGMTGVHIMMRSLVLGDSGWREPNIRDEQYKAKMQNLTRKSNYSAHYRSESRNERISSLNLHGRSEQLLRTGVD